ncbi:ATPase [Novosphingobium flavum]|uniref:ATPase n=1 Tax=Novosphingobium flavum TaxID=1778672 RepID=A0A7X1KMK1_9SPHN|nr:ATPase [Novosphingobium flavum]MBC2666390.1 ATPase [Novosphingobium flavum]
MSGGSRIVAFGPGGDKPLAAGELTLEAADALPEEVWPEDKILEDEPEPEAMRRNWLVPALGLAAVAGWTGYFFWAMWTRISSGTTPSEGVSLLGNWAVPVLLIGVAWLIALRTSRREARRFGEAAFVLSTESARLEARLITVNRELSLAREFIAAQSRDLEALGRISAERISEHAARLQELIRSNGAQVEAIASVSTTALDNMERLRGQLPVIASSAKDVTNNIGNAGRTAQGVLGELIAAFDRLASAGAAGEAQVGTLHGKVDEALGLFHARLGELQAVVSGRLEELEHRAGELRARLADDEAAGLAALKARAEALAEEFAQTRVRLDETEAESLTSLRARLSALRDEGSALARALRDGEKGALQALHTAKNRLEEEVRGVLERLDALDRQALEAARNRIATLSQEASDFDERLLERNRQFLAETEQRLADTTGQFARIDQELDERRAEQNQRQQALAASGEAIAMQIEAMSDRIAAIAAFGHQAEESLGNGLGVLTDRLGASREALAGTHAAVTDLTDGAVRLLELIQASTAQSRDQLPAALAQGQAGLEDWEQRVAAMAETIRAASAQGDVLAATTADTRAALGKALDELGALQGNLGEGADRHGQKLGALREGLAALEQESLATAGQAQDALTAAIEQLGEATRSAVANLRDESAGAVSQVAERLGEESAAAIDRAMRMRMAEAIGQLEQAAGHAAGVSREAAIQLRDQLGKVAELTANLERRVAHAKARAEEQVDNDFARRVALITESLNSNAIDIAKSLSTEVTDTAWAAYLKGDRGVFTRRAVRLIDNSEGREITRIYEEDGEFRDYVSRYIHDFEAMLRQLLSTRDGHALGVTLLSSDMGKLYVVLAQAIERLRH